MGRLAIQRSNAANSNILGEIIHTAKINVTHRGTFTLVLTLAAILLVASVHSYTRTVPNPGYGADRILIAVNGREMTFQDALDQHLFGDKQGGVNAFQCVSVGGMCYLICPENYVIVQINRGEMCGGDSRYPSTIKCCRIR